MIEISVRLENDPAVPLYRQLYDFIKKEITDGVYPCSSRLPSKRRLSESLRCSQNTVSAAYQQLAAEGYIASRPRSGYYVSRIDGLVSLPKAVPPPMGGGRPEDSCPFDFSYQGVDPEHFPFSAWRRITKEVISEYDPDLLRTGDPAGFPGLRAVIAGYLRQSGGVVCAPDQIVVSSGTEYLLQLLVQLFSEDDVFVIENPGYEKLGLLFRSSRARYRTAALDDCGMTPEAVRETGGNIACVTPSHQFPTGTIMPVSRRVQLLNWAVEKPDRWIVEDGYDSEFKYDGRPIPSLQSLDRGGRVIYMGAFSKSLTPALRISYMVLPEPLLRRYREKLSFYICPVPTVEQKTLARFVEEGHFERHLNRMRTLYRQKREILVAALRAQLPVASIEGASAGLHLVLRVRNGMDETALVDAAKTAGVRVDGLSRYYDGPVPTGSDGLLLGFATMTAGRIEEAVSRLQRAWMDG